MVTAVENERLTRVTGDAPMANLLRDNYWIPFARSESLPPGGTPQRVRLLGQDLVAFRAENGCLGLVDERCPHRRASLALGRLEGCSLRCIYHGWRIDGCGAVVEVPSEGDRSAEFASRIRVNRYRVQEGGGLLWAFLGQGEAPELPPLPFMDLPPERRRFVRILAKCNWLQGFEGAIDTVHNQWLHTRWGGETSEALSRFKPTYEIDKMDYGLRTAAIRGADEPTVHCRVTEFVAPFYGITASRQPRHPGECSIFISVPVDDETHIFLFGIWNETGPLDDYSTFLPPQLDPDNFVTEADLAPGHWGQDREAMKAGHFSGLTKSVLHEDITVQISMGPIVDRSEEQLCSTDRAIMQARRFLLDLVRRHETGQAVDGALAAYAANPNRPFSCLAPSGTDWRDIRYYNILAQ